MACNVQVQTWKKDPSAEGEWVLESEKMVDHDDSSDRQWLGKHCFWALRNNRMIVTTPQ